MEAMTSRKLCTSSRSNLMRSRDNLTKMKQSSGRKTSSMYSEICKGGKKKKKSTLRYVFLR